MTFTRSALSRIRSLAHERVIPCTGTPSTVLDPERTIRRISLAECIATAMEQGVVGNQSLLNQTINPDFVLPDQPLQKNGPRYLRA